MEKYVYSMFNATDKLAGQRWRSKLGRPSKVPTLGDVDPTGTYCPVPEDWLKKKYGKYIVITDVYYQLIASN